MIADRRDGWLDGMRSAEIRSGRRFVVVLEPGDEVLTSLTAACVSFGITNAIVPVLLGAFTSVTLIGSDVPVADPDAPLTETTELLWTEGTGSATIAPDATGAPVVHLHGSFGDKLDAAAAYAGHVLNAVTHYTVEVVIEEVADARWHRFPDPAAHGIPTLRLT